MTLESAPPATSTPSTTPPVSFGEALRFWIKVGCFNFGGPTGQIAILHEELVVRRRWISEDRFLHALNFCMLLPGPEAQQLATYFGWLLHRTRGAIVAGAFFVIPSIFILFALSFVHREYGAVPWIAALFAGLRPAVVAIVAAAILRIARRSLRRPLDYAVAIAAGLAFAAHAPFPLVIAIAGAIGLVTRAPSTPATEHEAPPASPVASNLPSPSWPRTARVAAVFAFLGTAPYAALVLWRGAADVLAREAVFFTKAAVVTFGGAYAVLPYVARRAVEDFGWLTSTQMIDGLALAETTPGPLIMVVQFVGFYAGTNGAADLGTTGALLGGLIATYFTFLPSFAWVLLGAPSVERLRGDARIAGALSVLGAAVVGVMVNLALWFAKSVFVPFDSIAVVVALVAFVGLTRFKWGILTVVGGAAVVSLLRLALVKIT